jgi:hypothetical protein
MVKDENLVYEAVIKKDVCNRRGAAKISVPVHGM